ncbi:MAG: alpha/beta hydrolase [Candidatus Rokubacteria bacterium]|nr:alpha/beta hydrolase [Candidatus Rokubacteria bacterium]
MSTDTGLTDRFVTVRGLRFHVVEGGARAAPAVVFLHGITAHALTWDEEACALAARFHVVAIDQRGHGDSDPAPDGDYDNPALVDDFAAIVDALDLSRFHLVGLSLGGRVAIAYAGTHPERVDRLVVVDIGPDIAPAGLARIGTLLGSAPERFERVEDAIAWMRAANPLYTEARLRHRVEHGLRRLADGGFTWKYDRAIRDRARPGRLRAPVDLWPLWKAIAAPTLLVRGADSDILSDGIAQRMIDAQPRAQLAVVPGAGHTVPGDQPEAFLRLLTGFLTAR